MGAFPAIHFDDEGLPTHSTEDLSLRDYFAGQAVDGVLAAWPKDTHRPPDQVARDAFDIAEAMVIERAERIKADRRERLAGDSRREGYMRRVSRKD